MVVVVAATQNCDDAERAEHAKQGNGVGSVVSLLVFQIVDHELEDEDGAQGRGLNQAKLKAVLHNSISGHLHDRLVDSFFLNVRHLTSMGCSSQLLLFRF